MSDSECRSKKTFAAASEDVRLLTKRILQDERLVQFQKRRILPTGLGIHDALLRHVKEAVR